MFTAKDLNIFEKKEISQEKVQWQLNLFKNGIEPIVLVAAANTENGIIVLENPNTYISIYKNANISVAKFIPASGAASRMFKVLFEYRKGIVANDSLDFEHNSIINDFFINIKKFAFYPDLDFILKEYGGMERLVAEKKHLLILDTLLNQENLAYGMLPKGLLKFHFYAGNIGRTPFEEHLVEGAKYAKSSDGEVNLHFTVSPEHINLFIGLKDKVISKYEDMYRVKYNISFSVQKSSTDTIAVNTDNTPFYDKNGDIFFRPGGHGALIENLNEIDSDIIFIKNIDNVVPEKKLEGTTSSKQALAGFLLSTQNKVFQLCKNLTENPSDSAIAEAKKFLEQVFCLSMTCIEQVESDKTDAELVLERLNRPIRVCGMIRNDGDTGGGPFLVKDNKECVSLQVVESLQIDLNNPEQEKIYQSASYFNPVDLVCAVKDFEGNRFDLKKYIDNDTCFISCKSKDGKDLKALELPGLWNGAMAGWNTIFVEVPASTFNPVKTVNDLLLEAHQ